MHDASAKSEGGLSLDDALDKGPNFLPLLCGILLRFQIGKDGVVGDLEKKAFLRLLLHDEDRNVCCFLGERLRCTDTKCQMFAISAASSPETTFREFHQQIRNGFPTSLQSLHG